MSSVAEHDQFRSPPIEREHFELILNVARRLASSSDLHEILGMIIDALKVVLHADRASVFQYDPKSHELFATRAHGLATDLRLAADRGIIGEAARARQIVNIPDAYADPRFNQDVDRRTGYTTRCLLTIPLLDFDRKLIGVAQVLNKDLEWGGVFSEQDELLAQHLADQAAMALKRASLLEAEREKDRLVADIQVAKKIQQAALPKSLPTLAGYDIAADTLPADETGGDAFDVIDLRLWSGAHAPADALIFLADATGHGIGPALSITQALSMIRMGCRIGAPLDGIARHLNHQLCADLPTGRFVTAFLGYFDLARHQIRYISAGQAPVLLIRAPGSKLTDEIVLAATAMPFGIDDDFTSDTPEPLVFEPGDTFALLSDGFYEAACPGDELFGHERVVEIIRANARGSAGEILAALRREVVEFTHGCPRADDQTAMIIKRVN